MSNKESYRNVNKTKNKKSHFPWKKQKLKYLRKLLKVYTKY